MKFNSLRRNEVQAKLADRACIADACFLYATAVDLLGNGPHRGEGPDLVLSEAVEILSQALMPSAIVRLFLMGADGPSQQLGTGGPAECARAVRNYFGAYGYVGTHHPVSNVRIDFLDENNANATSSIPCYHWLADHRMLLVPVDYRDRLTREQGTWKIAARDILARRFWVANGYTPLATDPSLSPVAPLS